MNKMTVYKWECPICGEYGNISRPQVYKNVRKTTIESVKNHLKYVCEGEYGRLPENITEEEIISSVSQVNKESKLISNKKFASSD